VQHRGTKKGSNTSFSPLGERPPSHYTLKAQFSLTQQTHQTPVHMERGLGGGIGANV